MFPSIELKNDTQKMVDTINNIGIKRILPTYTNLYQLIRIKKYKTDNYQLLPTYTAKNDIKRFKKPEKAL